MTSGRTTAPPTENSILEALDERARLSPERTIFTFLDEEGLETETLTYSRLVQQGRAVAGELQRLTKPGDRALLIYQPGLDFISALFGCFYAGVIAVPVSPPRWELLDGGLRPLANLAGDCRPAAMLSAGALGERLKTARGRFPALSAAIPLMTDAVPGSKANEFEPLAIGRERIALLQYTSGSTQEPKGVVITHGNILHGEYAVQMALHHHTAERAGCGVCWLPFYHDMCLFGSILQAIYVDAPAYHLSPLVLLQRPVRWLGAITRYGAHTSAGPGFAYDLCVRRITDEQKASLDLSRWEVAAIGAEPVSPATMRRFAEAFAGCGFRYDAFYPCYGLAEATLLVSGGERDASPVVRTFSSSRLQYHPRCDERSAEGGEGDAEIEQELVGCGRAWAGHEIVIADPESGLELPEGEVGEIWFAGPSVAAGYWGRAEESREAFGACLADTGRGPFLRTGDLGFIDGGELFVCGRIKDLIVIRGRNHYPQDIEETVRRVHEAFLPNSGAAFACPHNGEERLVVLQEIDRTSRRLDVGELLRAIRRQIAEQHQLQVADIVFLRRGALPRTTSGKVRRREAMRMYAGNRFAAWGPKTPPAAQPEVPNRGSEAS